MPAKWRFLKACNTLPLLQIGTHQRARLTIQDELDEMQYVRCVGCDGIGHSAGGMGQGMEKKLSSCPNKFILRKRLGKRQTTRTILNSITTRVATRASQYAGEGYNGGGMQNGRVQGHYNPQEHLLALLNRYEAWRAVQVVAGNRANQQVWTMNTLGAFWALC